VCAYSDHLEDTMTSIRANRSTFIFAAGLTAALYALACYASSHREAPLITETPKVDGVDFYMFRSYESGRAGFVTLIADYLPLQDPYGGPNYFQLDPRALYEIHIDNTGRGIGDITFQFRFQNASRNLTVPVGGVDVPVALIDVGPVGTGGNPADTQNLNVLETYTLSVIRGAVASNKPQPVINASTGGTTFTKPVDNIGQKTLPDYAAYAAAQIFTAEIPGCGAGRVFVGQRKDPFVVNLGQTFDLVNIANPIGDQFANAAHDDLADKNVTSLILEVPISCLVAKDPVIGGWTTASRCRIDIAPPQNARRPDRDVEEGADCDRDDRSQMVQVSRLGSPLVNEIVIGLKDKDGFNASVPADDAQFLTYVTNPTLPALLEKLFFNAGVRAPTRFPRDDLIAAFLTGIPGLNRPSQVNPSEMLRLNTSVPPIPAGSQNRLGVLAGDLAGFPNGRRPGDDAVDAELRVAMGALIAAGLFGNAVQAPSGNLQFTDGAIVNDSFFDAAFPYLRTPLPGSPGPQPTSSLGIGAQAAQP
jgi:hypothetical protein